MSMMESADRPEVHLVSAAARKIDLLTETGASLGSATAVLVSDDADNVWLVSNWHVFAGRNPETGRPLHESAATPASMTMHLPRLSSRNSSDAVLSIPLVLPGGSVSNGIDVSGWSVWRQHAVLGRDVDVAAILLPSNPTVDRLGGWAVPMIPRYQSRLSVTDDLSIVGYPQGYDQTSWPVWTRGSVASEPTLDFGDRPRFLVDAQTKRGQSGAPVVSSGYTLNDMVDIATGEEMAMATFAHPITQLVGIYSGRLNDSIQLGFVWKRTALVDVVRFGTPVNAIDL